MALALGIDRGSAAVVLSGVGGNELKRSILLAEALLGGRGEG